MKSLETIIEKYISDRVALKKLAGHAKHLSDLFTKQRSDIGIDYFDDKMNRLAYIAHFTLTNAAKVYHCLEQLPEIKSDKVRILDLGCGPGAGSLAASSFFAKKYPEAKLQITAVDENLYILKDAEELFWAINNEKHTFSTSQSINRGTYDIIIAANVINELDKPESSLNLIKQLLEEHLNDNGHIIIIDPALKKTTRPLMEVRNRLVSDGIATITAPCLHQGNCPMIEANERDWCHFYIEWNRPKLVEKMDALVGTDHTYLKMGYLILTDCHREEREARGDVTGIASPDFCLALNDKMFLHRVVSSPLVSKGKRELFLCGSDGNLRRIRRMDRDASESNRDMDEAKRGDIVKYAGPDRLSKDDRFESIET